MAGREERNLKRPIPYCTVPPKADTDHRHDELGRSSTNTSSARNTPRSEAAGEAEVRCEFLISGL